MFQGQARAIYKVSNTAAGKLKDAFLLYETDYSLQSSGVLLSLVHSRDPEDWVEVSCYFTLIKLTQSHYTPPQI